MLHRSGMPYVCLVLAAKARCGNIRSTGEFRTYLQMDRISLLNCRINKKTLLDPKLNDQGREGIAATGWLSKLAFGINKILYCID